MNNFQNRLSADVSELYLFPSLSEAKGAFNLSLSLQLLGERIITSASKRRLKLVLATLFFGELTISYRLCQLNISRTLEIAEKLKDKVGLTQY
ncbi:MAG: hypothetical protein RMZ43_025470 [Nostoc sp. CmiVER01]|uniref:hypothetical protein n=1 Tax=Nostoc sp. CmiVER01 TaxID=3075384 RepID=UPI002AD354DF|nr:hypothetical protein [Nostoc sp. CmiVER01]MDZ8121786.1 hypothetical protein [Nostoc sp. CmiVER01]